MKEIFVLTQFLKKKYSAKLINYVLIVSIGSVLALQPPTIGTRFGNHFGSVAICLTTGPCA
jgi:hypothetical protein